jgi:diguanylate cyclase (GGDEF)-like protein
MGIDPPSAEMMGASGMNGELLPFTAGLFVSAGISLAIAIYVQRWQTTPGIKEFSLQLILQAVWALGYAFETIAPDLATKLLFRKIAWIGILLAPLCWALFILRYTHHDGWLNRRVRFGILAPVALILLTAFTNELHHLFWSSTTLAPGIGTGVLYERGPFFWIAVGVEYLAIVMVIGELVWLAVRSHRLFRNQAILLAVSSIIPLVVSLLFVFKITYPNDWTPIGFIVTGLVVTVAIFRYHMFTLVPAARGSLFEFIPDGLLAFDAHEYILDANPAMLKIAGFEGPVPAGYPLKTLFTHEPDLLVQIRRLRSGESVVAEAGGGRHAYEISATRMQVHPSSSEGRLVAVREVTERQDIERRLRLSEESMRRLFEANPIPQVMVGLDTTSIYAYNQAFLDFFKLAEGGMPQLPALIFFGKDPARQQLLEELTQKRALRSKMVEIERAPNDTRTVLLNADIVDFLGSERILVVYFDISERLRLEQAEHEQHVLSEVLRESAFSISSTLELDEVLDRILGNLNRILNFHTANILLLNDARVATVARTIGYPEHGLESPFGKAWLPLESTPNLRWMEQNRRAQIIADATSEPGWIPLSGQEWIRGFLSAPLITAQGVVGFIAANAVEPDYYTEADAERLMIFANQAAVAIDNARLYARIRKSAQETEVLQQITMAANSSLRFTEVVQRIFELINRLVPSDSAGLLLFDGDEIVLRAVRGFRENDAIVGMRWKRSGTANERVYQTRRPMIFQDVQAEFDGYRIPPHNHVRSVLMIPLLAGGDVIGILSLDSWVLAHFTEDDLRLARLFAGDVAVGLENARLYEEARARTEELEIINRVGTAITSGLDLDHVLVMLYEQCRQVMETDSFYVALYHEDRGEIEFPLFQDQGIYRQVHPLQLSSNTGMAGCVIEEAHTIYLPDSLDPNIQERYRLIRYGGLPTRSYLGVPMYLRDKVLGVISTQSTRANAYTVDQIRLLETIAAQAAIAIENARLYKQAQTAATTDDLTGLLNRRELFRRAEQELARAVRYRSHLAMVMIDFDHFKGVNDTYGHLAGDQVLRFMTRICQENMRLVDVVGRYGGEEILVLMPETTADQALQAAERLRAQIERTTVQVDEMGISVTISAGVAELRRDSGMTLEGLIAQADMALFVAKSQGRNRVGFSAE